jgi:hypothetical protein
MKLIYVVFANCAFSSQPFFSRLMSIFSSNKGDISCIPEEYNMEWTGLARYQIQNETTLLSRPFVDEYAKVEEVLFFVLFVFYP